MGKCDCHDACLHDVCIHAEIAECDRNGYIKKVLINGVWYVPETSLYSLEERATCNAWTIKRLKNENAELRELCASLYEFAYDEYPDGTELSFADRMRELRIEVE